MNIESLIEALRSEARIHIDCAEGQMPDSVWTARMSAAHVLFSLAHAIRIGNLECPHAESSSSQSATKTAEDSFLR